MAGILQKIKRTACSRGPFLYSNQNHGQDSTTPELIRRLAEQVFGNKEKADIWLNQPKATFNDCTPLEIARDESGYLRVKEALDRIAHGFSF
ncbi:DUF2384 domain-containing protein [Pseudomonas sp. HMWF031]|nr:DUF2384 domain-containing protein [Pseudomonas sp. HMWF031]